MNTGRKSRIETVNNYIGSAHIGPEGVHAFANFTFNSLRGNNNFLTPLERRLIAVSRLGINTNIPQIITRVQTEHLQDRYVLSSRNDNAFELTITDELPNGSYERYRIGMNRCSDEARDAFLLSPFVYNLVQIVTNNS